MVGILDVQAEVLPLRRLPSPGQTDDNTSDDDDSGGYEV